MSTPMLKQYNQIKSNYKDELLFFRLGDFYELFYDDAKIASKILGITLTKKSKEIPMCGVPHHSANSYIVKLVEEGYRVAICEQLEDAKLVKGIVKRDVVRVITPGSILDDTVLDETKNNYIMCIFKPKKTNEYGISIVDISTGEFTVTSLERATKKNLFDEIAKFNPKEIIINYNFSYIEEIKNIFGVFPRVTDEKSYTYIESTKLLKNHFESENKDLITNVNATRSCGGLLNYLIETQKNSLQHINTLKMYSNDSYMTLDLSTRKNLELTESINEKSKKGTLISVIDKTKTSMGARLLNKFIQQPLLSSVEIQDRLDAVDELKFELIFRNELQDNLKGMYDIERLVSKIVYNTANPRDLLSIGQSLKKLPHIDDVLSNFSSKLLCNLKSELILFERLDNLISISINEDAPINLKDGNVVKDGFSNELDEYRKLKNSGNDMLLQLESAEKEKTNIKNLRIKYNKIFGYFFEVTSSYLNLVPDYFVRKQTLTNCERFITDDLKKLEEKILSADEKILELEAEIFSKIKKSVYDEIEKIQSSAEIVSYLDVLLSFAEVAEKSNYCKPNILNNGSIKIVGGRHPVVEQIKDVDFVSNDLTLDDDGVMLITGPNMSGKSTYMRQVALICLMTQIGCFVPAASCDITPADRIFTRIGASDNLASGYSTFMVEMVEIANILDNATNNSLLIVDEVGRGTSTFDGLSIALSVLEYMAKEIKAKTLFATHYHELTEASEKIANIENYSVSVKEDGENIIFLHKIQKGCIDHSYGIHVAKLAGLPTEIIDNAKNILTFLEKNENMKDKIGKNVAYKNEDKDLYGKTIISNIAQIDVDNLSPRDALKLLYDLKEKSKHYSKTF